MSAPLDGLPKTAGPVHTPDAHPWEAPQTNVDFRFKGARSVLEWMWSLAFVILALMILWGFVHRK
jgi:hypothetical protein